MSEDRKGFPPLRFSLRRLLYGWAGMVSAMASVACLAYWTISLRSSRADFDAVYVAGLYLSADNGELRLRDYQLIPVKKTLEHFHRAEEEKQFRARLPQLEKQYPGATADAHFLFCSDHVFNLPGLHYRRVEYLPGGTPIWMVSFSPLIPFGVTATLAGIFLYRFAATYRSPHAHPAPLS
jgi:hypothetical protein